MVCVKRWEKINSRSGSCSGEWKPKIALLREDDFIQESLFMELTHCFTVDNLELSAEQARFCETFKSL